MSVDEGPYVLLSSSSVPFVSLHKKTGKLDRAKELYESCLASAWADAKGSTEDSSILAAASTNLGNVLQMLVSSARVVSMLCRIWTTKIV